MRQINEKVHYSTLISSLNKEYKNKITEYTNQGK